MRFEFEARAQHRECRGLYVRLDSDQQEEASQLGTQESETLDVQAKAFFRAACLLLGPGYGLCHAVELRCMILRHFLPEKVGGEFKQGRFWHSRLAIAMNLVSLYSFVSKKQEEGEETKLQEQRSATVGGNTNCRQTLRTGQRGTGVDFSRQHGVVLHVGQ